MWIFVLMWFLDVCEVVVCNLFLQLVGLVLINFGEQVLWMDMIDVVFVKLSDIKVYVFNVSGWGG